MMGIALLQNGQLLTFLLINDIEELVTSTTRTGHVWVFQDLSEGPSITSSSKANKTQACPLNSLKRDPHVTQEKSKCMLYL